MHRESGSVRHLVESQETLAELFRDRGYRTVCISANSFVSETVGLTQGCEVIRPGKRNLRGDEVLEFLESSLGPGAPLFVFLNLYEAHDPWQEIPKGVGWVPERDLPENDFAQRWAFVRGELEGLSQTDPAEERSHDIHHSTGFRRRTTPPTPS